MRNNSIIIKNPQEHHIFDLTQLGTIMQANKLIEITQPNHFFQVGDVLYYNVQKQMFGKAIAVNNIESEVCGVVSDVQDKDTFTLIAKGKVITARYDFENGSPLYLSEVHPGKLVSIEPRDIIKQVAIQVENGIEVDIKRGYKIANTQIESEELEPYIQSELDEIIKNIW